MVGICRNCGQSSDAHDDEVCKNVWPKQPPSAPDTKPDEIAVTEAQIVLRDCRLVMGRIGDAVPGAADEMGRLCGEIATAHDALHCVRLAVRRVSSSPPEGEDTQPND